MVLLLRLQLTMNTEINACQRHGLFYVWMGNAFISKFGYLGTGWFYVWMGNAFISKFGYLRTGWFYVWMGNAFVSKFGYLGTGHHLGGVI